MKIYNKNTVVLFKDDATSILKTVENAVFRGVNLREANLRFANLRGAFLSGANFGIADLYKANLRGANLENANLRYTNLQDANLGSANLHGADLWGANLRGAKLPKFQIPQRKSLTVYKKLRNHAIARLRIPARARRTTALVGNKCRAEYAIVEKIWAPNGTEISSGISIYNPNFKYEVGKKVSVSNFDDDIREECKPGIHFFMTREKAEEY